MATTQREPCVSTTNNWCVASGSPPSIPAPSPQCFAYAFVSTRQLHNSWPVPKTNWMLSIFGADIRLFSGLQSALSRCIFSARLKRYGIQDWHKRGQNNNNDKKWDERVQTLEATSYTSWKRPHMRMMMMLKPPLLRWKHWRRLATWGCLRLSYCNVWTKVAKWVFPSACRIYVGKLAWLLTRIFFHMVNLIVNWCQLWVFIAFFFPSLLPRHSGCSNWRPHWFGSLNRFEAGKRPRNYIVKKNGSKQLVIQPPDLWYWNILGRFVECIFFLQWPELECLFGGGFVAPKGGEEFGFFQFWFPRFQAWDLRTQWKCLRMRAAACLGPMEGLEGQVSTTQDVNQKGNGQTKSQQPCTIKNHKK